jgi:hypothetical protein
VADVCGAGSYALVVRLDRAPSLIDTGRIMWGEDALALDLAGRRQTVAR